MQPYPRRVGGRGRPEETYTAGSFRGFGRCAGFDDVDNLAILITMSDGPSVLVTGARHSPRDHDFDMEVLARKTPSPLDARA